VTSPAARGAPFAAAAVDIGTNSLLLTVARPAPGGRLVVLEDRSVITRLGEGLGERGALGEAAMERTLAVLEEFGGAILALGATARAAGTSALRRADNAGGFLARARDALGVEVEVLSGVAEASLGARGALSELPGVTRAQAPIVLDPGGGSTEVICTTAEGGIASAVSLEVGAVRLTEAFVRSDPPALAELDALAARARAIVAPLAPAAGRPVVAVGGTATTLAALHLGLDRYDGARVHGTRVGRADIAALRARLAALPLAAREAIPCLPRGRADIAVAGAALLEALLDRLGAAELTVSDRGLRFGLIAELLER
jgi:exopolyphosphatase / guanosine-5'-triphosphate,3'-diphosphate pyrophosphatase